MLRLRKFLRALLRMRRSADFVFGIDQGQISYPERATVAKSLPMSTMRLRVFWLTVIRPPEGSGRKRLGVG
jgi:hypothetical protein